MEINQCPTAEEIRQIMQDTDAAIPYDAVIYKIAEVINRDFMQQTLREERIFFKKQEIIDTSIPRRVTAELEEKGYCCKYQIREGSLDIYHTFRVSIPKKVIETSQQLIRNNLSNNAPTEELESVEENAPTEEMDEIDFMFPVPNGFPTPALKKFPTPVLKNNNEKDKTNFFTHPVKWFKRFSEKVKKDWL